MNSLAQQFARTLGLVALFLLLTSLSPTGGEAGRLFGDDFYTLRYQPAEYPRALRNPMKGFTHGAPHEWASLRHVYFRWNELENDESDGLDRILAVSNQRFAGGPSQNIKFIPRVYLHWSEDHQKYWPADMQEDDYTSEQFQARLIRLVERLGEAWNNDPRVAFIELGIFGKWGEHHSPGPTPAMQTIAGQAFQDAFPDKLVSVRHVWNEFQGFGFGVYWDSWGHHQQMWGHGRQIALANQAQGLYLHNYIGGEVAYDWGLFQTQPGANPTTSVSEAVHREFLINSIRWLHGTQLRWISAYDQNNPVAREGAEALQRVMGYRFVLEEVRFNSALDSGGLTVGFTVRNDGSAPFYYRWPVEVALHDPISREPVWQSVFDDLDIRSWTPGQFWTPPEWETISEWPQQAVIAGWSSETPDWGIPPASHSVIQTFYPDVPTGDYILTLAVLDPAGMRPALRFAANQYWHGGRHPIGRISVGQAGGGQLPADFAFDDPATDTSLHYVFEP